MQNFELSSELFAALIGVLIALLMAAIGWLINSRSAHRVWLRDQKVNFYAQLHGFYHLIRIYDPFEDSAEQHEMETTREYFELVSRARLLAPKKLDKAIGKLTAHSELRNSPETRGQYLELLESVLQLMRKDLGVK